MNTYKNPQNPSDNVSFIREKRVHPWIGIFCASCAFLWLLPSLAAEPRFSLLLAGLQRNPKTEFTIVTETTDEGRKLKPPTPDKPVYYATYIISS